MTPDPWFQFQLDLARCLLAVLPGAILWGASFPLALASVAADDGDPARLVGGVYAANTLGAIVGALGASLLLVVWLGTQRSQQFLIVACPPSPVWLLIWRELPAMRAFGAPSSPPRLLAFTVHPVPGMLIAYGRYVPSQIGQAEVIYIGEGWNASVAVSERSNGVLNYHNAGKVQASSEPQDMRLQRMLGHLTTLVPARAAKVLVIGCGAGVTAGAVSIDPTGRTRDHRRDRAAGAGSGLHLLRRAQLRRRSNPKVHVHIDDARHFLQTTNETFDAITSDPLDPWVKGAAMLYTREFFELVKSPPESRRRGHALRAALREQHRGGQE